MLVLGILSLYVSISLGTYVRVQCVKRIRHCLASCFLAPLFLVIFLVVGFRDLIRGNLEKAVYWHAIKHLDDVMFLYVLIVALIKEHMSKDEDPIKNRWQSINTSIYTGLNSY